MPVVLLMLRMPSIGSITGEIYSCFYKFVVSCSSRSNAATTTAVASSMGICSVAPGTLVTAAAKALADSSGAVRTSAAQAHPGHGQLVITFEKTGHLYAFAIAQHTGEVI